MKNITAAIGIISVLGLTGCATKGFVQTQTAPLADRIGKLEERAKALEAAAALPARLSDTDNARINQAGDNARQALDTANRASAAAAGINGSAKKAEDSAMKAEDSAKRSEESAKRSENAAMKAEGAAGNAQQAEQKSEKLFKLHQKK